MEGVSGEDTVKKAKYVSQWQKDWVSYNQKRKCPDCGGFVLLSDNWSELLYECVECGWREYE